MRGRVCVCLYVCVYKHIYMFYMRVEGSFIYLRLCLFVFLFIYLFLGLCLSSSMLVTVTFSDLCPRLSVYVINLPLRMSIISISYHLFVYVSVSSLRFISVSVSKCTSVYGHLSTSTTRILIVFPFAKGKWQTTIQSNGQKLLPPRVKCSKQASIHLMPVSKQGN